MDGENRWIVINHEREGGHVLDTTIRMYCDLESAEKRLVALMRNAFEETHTKDEIADGKLWDEFVNRYESDHIFRYTADNGHRYVARIVDLY